MELRQSIAPHFRLEETARTIMINQLIACAPLLLTGIIIYGFRALVMAFSGVCGAVLVESLWRFLAKQEQTFTDFSAIVTGVLIALMLPANASVLLPFFAAAFAIGIVKLPFGGFGRTPFNCAAAGYCFIALTCATGRGMYNRALLSVAERDIFDKLPQNFFTYTHDYLPAFANVPVSDSKVSDVISPLVLLRAGVDPKYSAGEILFGGMLGPMGAGIALVIVACAVWLFFRRALALQSVLSFCVTVILSSLIVGWNGIPRLLSPVYDLLGGATLLAAVFIFGDIFTAPHMRSARILYGICGGIITIVLHRAGSIECGEIFAAVIMNACATPLDRLVWHCRQRGFSLTKLLERIKQRLKKIFRLRSGPFDDIDLDELDFSRRGLDDYDE